MHENLEKVVRQWRDAGNALLAKDPDDRGDGLIKCANDLEAALRSKKPWSVIGAILAAGSLLFGEVFLEHQHSQVHARYRANRYIGRAALSGGGSPTTQRVARRADDDGVWFFKHPRSTETSRMSRL